MFNAYSISSSVLATVILGACSTNKISSEYEIDSGWTTYRTQEFTGPLAGASFDLDSHGQLINPLRPIALEFNRDAWEAPSSPLDHGFYLLLDSNRVDLGIAAEFTPHATDEVAFVTCRIDPEVALRIANATTAVGQLEVNGVPQVEFEIPTAAREALGILVTEFAVVAR